MKEINSTIQPLSTIDYQTIVNSLISVYQQEPSFISDFLDYFHHLYFSSQFDGYVQLINEIPVSILIFDRNNQYKITFLECLVPEQSQILIKLQLHHYIKNFTINPSDLRFEIWSHQQKLIESLRF